MSPILRYGTHIFLWLSGLHWGDRLRMREQSLCCFYYLWGLNDKNRSALGTWIFNLMRASLFFVGGGDYNGALRARTAVVRGWRQGWNMTEFISATNSNDQGQVTRRDIKPHNGACRSVKLTRLLERCCRCVLLPLRTVEFTVWFLFMCMHPSVCRTEF